MYLNCLDCLIGCKMTKDQLVCPNCGSTDLKRRNPLDKSDRPLLRSSVKGSSGLDIFVCQKCGYVGSCPIIDEKDILNFKQHLRNLDSD